jgi:hypothetical protein
MGQKVSLRKIGMSRMHRSAWESNLFRNEWLRDRDEMRRWWSWRARPKCTQETSPSHLCNHKLRIISSVRRIGIWAGRLEWPFLWSKSQLDKSKILRWPHWIQCHTVILHTLLCFFCQVWEFLYGNYCFYCSEFQKTFRVCRAHFTHHAYYGYNDPLSK